MSVSVVERQFYSRKEISIITGISVAALSQMAKRKAGPPCIKPAGYSCTIYPITETEAWMHGEGSEGKVSGGRGGSRKAKRKGRRTKVEERAGRQRLDAQHQDNTPSQPLSEG